MHSAMLLSAFTLANGHLLDSYYVSLPYRSWSDALWPDTRSWSDAPASTITRSHWQMSPEHYSVKIQTPAVEEGTISASLSSDGTMLNVNAKRYIEGCSCQESTVGQVRLPHTPRPEDIDLVHDPKNGVVSVKVARHAKADEPIPLVVKISEPVEAPKPRLSRSLPHASAMQKPEVSDKDINEKQLLEKFGALDKFRTAVTAVQASPVQEQPEPSDPITSGGSKKERVELPTASPETDMETEAIDAQS